MKTRTIIVLILLSMGWSVFPEDFEFELDGEIRTRAAYENNFDLENDTNDDLFAMDARIQLEPALSTPSSVYFYSQIEWGNIALDEDLFNTENFLENIRLEFNQIYMGYDFDFLDQFNLRAGLVPTNSPGKIVSDEDGFGAVIKAELYGFKLKSFYSLSNLVDGYFHWVEDPESLNHLLSLDLSSEDYLDSELTLWAMYLDGNDEEDYAYQPFWTGLEWKYEHSVFDFEGSFIYNGGNVVMQSSAFEIPLSSFYTNMEIRIEPVDDVHLFSRLHLGGGFDSERLTVNQFQSVEGEGSLETDLGLLFGGSAFGSESYFSNESVSLVEKNLSNGNLVFDDPGLFIYELGVRVKIDFLDLKTDLVIGGAHLGSLFTGDSYLDSLLGLEMDLHTKMEFMEDLSLGVDFGLLYPGNAFEEAYACNHPDTVVGYDPSFKMDMELVYSF